MRVVYFVTESGRRPAEEFVKSLNIRSKEKFFSVVDLLEEFGKSLSFPHAKYIGDEIFELRFESLEGSVRVLYFRRKKKQQLGGVKFILRHRIKGVHYERI